MPRPHPRHWDDRRRARHGEPPHPSEREPSVPEPPPPNPLLPNLSMSSMLAAPHYMEPGGREDSRADWNNSANAGLALCAGGCRIGSPRMVPPPPLRRPPRTGLGRRPASPGHRGHPGKNPAREPVRRHRDQDSGAPHGSARPRHRPGIRPLRRPDTAVPPDSSGRLRACLAQRQDEARAAPHPTPRGSTRRSLLIN